MRYAANLTFMYPEYPALERFKHAAEAGFTHAEFLFPEQHDIGDLEQVLKDSGITMILFDSDRGDFANGERGYLCHPGREQHFQQSILDAVTLARRLGARMINPLAGKVPAGVSRDQAKAVAIDNLKRVAPIVQDVGLMLCIEGLNTYDNPGYLVDRSDIGFEIVDAVDSPSVKYLYDAFHMQIMEGNLITTIGKNLDRIGHIQISDVPGRHEPGTGEINYPNVLRAIDEAGYQGYCALEYHPTAETEATLGWLPRDQRGNR